MCKVLLGKALSKEVTEMAKNNEHEVADVRCDQNIVRRFFYFVFGDGFIAVVL